MKVYCNIKSKANLVNASRYLNSDIVILGFNGLNKISYKSELSGKENLLQEFSALSKNQNKVFISGAITDNYGLIKNSAVIVENGKLLGIADGAYSVNDSKKAVGGTHRVYKTSNARIGVIIGDDILDVFSIQAMSICDADVIICITLGEETSKHSFLVRSYAYLFGVPFLLVTENSVIASDINGEIVGSTTNFECEINLELKKSFRKLSLKRRGV